MMISVTENRTRLLYFAAIVIVYLLGAILVDIMDVDAAQYATIPLEMIRNNDYLHVYDRNVEYLDKPPLLFWSAALSYKIFGFSNFAFKLPSILFALLAIWSTYRLALVYYDVQKARLAALFLASTQALFLITNDTRTDTMLMGAVAMAVAYIAAYLQSGRWLHWFLGFTGVGLAMLAKGPIGLVVPIMALGGHTLASWKWSDVFKWQWLPGLLWVGIILLPMCIGLYEQFDLHPEKTVNGKTGVSGLRFFFWTQSFGRITGESEWVNDGGYDFFLHTFLWAFSPWSVFFVVALFMAFIDLIKNKLKPSPEIVSLCGFVLPFVALSLSRYKLPHYIFVCFPFAAIMLAAYWDRVVALKPMKYIHYVLMACLWVLVGLLAFWVFPDNTWLNALLLVVMAAATYYMLRSEQPPYRLITLGLCTAIAVNVIMATHFYPQLLKYQPASTIGSIAKDEGIPHNKFFYFNTKVLHSLEAYYGNFVHHVHTIDTSNAIENRGRWLFTNDGGLEQIKAAGLKYRIVYAHDNYIEGVTNLNILFLNPSTRHTQVEKQYLVEIL